MSVPPPDDAPLTAAGLGLPADRLGERATLLQVSSAFCAPCAGARVVARRVAETAEGVRHVEVDVAGHERLAAALQIRSTPTVLVLDGAGRVRHRVEGVPRLAWLREAVAGV
ncbi:thioredoxin family protein [Georgenia thermotolerans]|uniref:Thioredoxin n=1 Tax=Georgenia thermotolerans TaxID=527326 RepID=A0A7J5UPA4_9MICO|nr:thioredoxin family protein [Georgenia thermotolerans]KAE8764236.1 thioredoxin [Georgenia thermotolerans]